MKNYAAYLVSGITLILLTIAIYVYFATEYSLKRQLLGDSAIVPVLAFWPIPLTSTVIFYVLADEKKKLPKLSWLSVLSFIAMYVVLYIYISLTASEYRLSYNILDSGEILGMHILLFVTGLAINWIVAGILNKISLLHKTERQNIRL